MPFDPLLERLRRAGHVPPAPDRDGARMRAMAAIEPVEPTTRRARPKPWMLVAAAVLMVLPGAPLVMQGARGLIERDPVAAPAPVALAPAPVDETRVSLQPKPGPSPAQVERAPEPVEPKVKRAPRPKPARPEVGVPEPVTQTISITRPAPQRPDRDRVENPRDPCDSDSNGNSRSCDLGPPDPCLPDRNGNSRGGLSDRWGNSVVCA